MESLGAVHTALMVLVLIGAAVADEEWTASLRSERVVPGGAPAAAASREEVTSHRREKRQAAPAQGAVTDLGPVSGQKLRAVTILNTPFTMADPKTGRFYGMIPDIFERIGHREQLRFTMYEVPDGRYGSRKLGTDEWTGMIGEVRKREKLADKTQEKYADIVGAPLTMTAGREQVVDFINPFKHTGIVMVMKKRAASDSLPVNFRVMAPLAPEVWATCTVAVVVVALVMFAINRLNPYEWSGRYNVGRASETQAETFNLSGSLWFAVTTFQWQGYERAPRSVAGRVLFVFWFAFTALTLITYTASLVNWLFWASTVHGKDYMSEPIADIEHLVMSNQYHYGCVRGGSTYAYLTQVGRGKVYDRIRTYITSEEGQKYSVNSTAQGFALVRKHSNYVFFAEELSALHEMNKQPCDIMTSGKPFAPRAYSMAHRPDLALETVDRLHAAVLEMQTDGTIDALEKKWFVDRGECWNVTKAEREVTAQTELTMRNSPKRITLNEFWGPLVLIIVGLVASIVAAVAEIAYFKYKGRYDPNNRAGSTQLKLDDDGNM